jgi:hypothetical protein
VKLALVLVSALAFLALAPLAAAQPPCTCDPQPCLFTDDPSEKGGCHVPDIPNLPPDLDPRNWPCACDPGPGPY